MSQHSPNATGWNSRWNDASPSHPSSYPPYPPPQPRWNRWKRWLVIGILVATLLVMGTACAIPNGGQGISNQAQAAPSPQRTQQVRPLARGTARASASSVKPTAKPTQTVSLAEHLTFSGDISGLLTAGVHPRPITHDNPLPSYVQQNGTFFAPAPTSTQCADFDSGVGQDYVAIIVGNVGTMRYAITIEINEDNPAYTQPGTALLPGDTNNGGSVEV